jgi:type IV pilus assembly protein PilW
MRTHIRQAGMSMVELMVAMAIALIGTIIIFQVFEVSEGIRRTTTSGGDAQQNGAIGLYVIENDLRNAGMGFNDTPYAGCNVTAFDSTRAPTGFTMLMSPVSITAGAGNTLPDSLSIFYGSQYVVANSTVIVAAMGAPTANVKIASSGRYGFREGDLLILAQPGTANCELMEVTALPNADEISHDNTPNYNLAWVPGGVGVASRFNPPGGSFAFGGTGAAATRVYNLGNSYDDTGVFNLNGPTMPVYNTYAVANNTLTVASKFSSAAAVPIADNIVHMRALYGLDDGVNNNTVTINAFYVAGDGIVDRFVDAATFDAMATKPWQYIAVVRVVMVARSALAEKPSGGGVCDTTTAAPTWSGSNLGGAPFNFSVSLDLSADANWQCYRYKVFETTVPLRNWIWKSS